MSETNENPAPEPVPLAPADYCDPVIEVYKKDVDRTLLRENLKLTVEERLLKAQRLHKIIDEVQRIRERLRARNFQNNLDESPE